MVQPKVSRILAVDDSPDNLFLLETLLEDLEEYELKTIDSGNAALQHIEQFPPDLILLDVMMPEIDGYEFTRRIRQNSTLPFIPILLITAHTQSSVVEGLDAGADDFIRKPFKVDELMARIRALLRLKHSIDERENVLRQRDDFVARLTHDLRTPLVATNRVLEFCLRGTYGENLSDLSPAISGVIDNNKHLLHMVNTLLEVYRHEAGRKRLTLTKLDFWEVVQEVAQQLKPLADEKGLDFKVEQDPVEDVNVQNPYQIVGDRLELRRVITNLVGNAIKFTETGFVSLRLQRQKRRIDMPNTPTQQSDWITLEVQDTGPGIAPKDQKRIFEWFRQGASVKSGSGLGLHLAKRIVKLHQGKITVSSAPNKGSTFSVSLPTDPSRD